MNMVSVNTLTQLPGPLGHALKLLLDSGCRFNLARPVPIASPISDLDLLMERADVDRLLNYLKQNKIEFRVHVPCSAHTVWIRLFGLLLDIRTAAAFLPFKSLSINIDLPAATCLREEKGHIIPDMSDNALFTWWSLHLLLDKRTPDCSSGFNFYRSYFADNWKECIDSSEFANFCSLLLSNSASHAHIILKNAFAHSWSKTDLLICGRFKWSFLLRSPQAMLGHASRLGLCLIEQNILRREF